MFPAVEFKRREPSASGARVADKDSLTLKGVGCQPQRGRAGGVFVWSVGWKRQVPE